MHVSRKVSFTHIAVIGAAAAIGLTSFIEPGEARLLSPPSPVITVVATDLHNPRGLDFAPDGSLYVAEAGGNGAASANCGVMGDGQNKCSASTGSVTRIDLETGDVARVLTGLPSLISADGTANGATGPHDVSFNGLGNGYVTIGLGGDPNNRGPFFGAAGENYGRLTRTNPSRKIKVSADIAGYEAENNPDGFVPDSNPYGVLALPSRVVIADAGGNDLIEVAANGKISTLAVFPRVIRPSPPGPPSVQAVPTSVAMGPDGDLYVGQLTGGPFTVGIASVYRVPAKGGTPEVAYGGFTNIIDIAFGPDGSLYILEIARNAIPDFGGGGRLVRIQPDGTQTDIISGMPLFAPGGVTVGKDGAIYVTVGSITTAGAVLKIVI